MRLETLVKEAISSHHSGNFIKAEELCKQAIKLQPSDNRAYRIWGLMAHQHGNVEMAEMLLNKALELDINNPDIYLELALVISKSASLESGRSQQAINLLETAFKLDPSNSQPLLSICYILIEYNDLDEAAKLAELAIEVDPDKDQPYITRAQIYKLQGKLVEAREDLEKALELNKNSANALGTLVMLSKYKEKDKAEAKIKKIKAMLKNQLSKVDESLLNFALAKIYDEQKNYNESFKHLEKANALRRSSIIYDAEQNEKKIQYFMENLDIKQIDNIKPNLEAYSNYPTPIFILGMPRSGSSLTEQILSSHPEVYGGGELYFMPQILGLQRDSVHALNELYEKICNYSPEEITNLGLKYLTELKRISGGNYKYVSDKLPGNFMYAGLIHKILPQAIIIYTSRNPVDICFSCYQQNFTYGHNYSFDLRELGLHYKSHAKFKAFWDQHMPGILYESNYEKLTENQETETRKLLEHCGLSWNDACLKFNENTRYVNTASVLQVKEPMHRQSVQKWKHYEQYLSPLLEAL